MDDVRVGRILRSLRRRRGWTQSRLAGQVGLSQQAISLIERGHGAALAGRTMQRVFGALEARWEPAVTWRGGALDRLLDEDHSRLVAAVAQPTARHGVDDRDRGDLFVLRRARFDRRARGATVTWCRSLDRGEVGAHKRRGNAAQDRREGSTGSARRLPRPVPVRADSGRRGYSSCPRRPRAAVGCARAPSSWTRRCPRAAPPSAVGSLSQRETWPGSGSSRIRMAVVLNGLEAARCGSERAGRPSNRADHAQVKRA